MFVKTLFLLILAILAFAQPHPQNGDAGDDTGNETVKKASDIDVNSLSNRIEFLKVTPHTPNQGGDKEGDILTIKVNLPSQENIQQAQELVKFFSIAIGTGSETMVDNDFFMESERFPYPPPNNFEYKFQLPQQMENKQYCIVYTPFAAENGDDKPVIDGVPMESLYEVWFPIKGSLAEGAGPKTVQNTAQNDPVSAQAPQGNMEGENGEGFTSSREAEGQDSNSSSIIISPAITAFIAVLFACFFI